MIIAGPGNLILSWGFTFFIPLYPFLSIVKMTIQGVTLLYPFFLLQLNYNPFPSPKCHCPYRKCFLMLRKLLTNIYFFIWEVLELLGTNILSVWINHRVFCASNWCVLLELELSANVCNDASVQVDKYSCCKYFCLNFNTFLEYLRMCPWTCFP